LSISFDGVNKLISLSTGTTTLSVPDLYSRWKDFVKTGTNAKYLPAFSTTGGDPIDVTAGTSVPLYLFLVNGWKVKPQEANHTLNVTSGVLLVLGGGTPFIQTYGNYNVQIIYSQPVQAITVATGGSSISPQTISDSVWNASANSYNTSGTTGNKLNSASAGGVDYAALGLAVWNVLASTANTTGTMGDLQNKNLKLAQFLALQN
jgi:hypothetical protein